MLSQFNTTVGSNKDGCLFFRYGQSLIQDCQDSTSTAQEQEERHKEEITQMDTYGRIGSSNTTYVILLNLIYDIKDFGDDFVEVGMKIHTSLQYLK